ncbi:aminotransferase class III-fold pyridoxal phosphate-dependent enzyme [Bosea sp. (in: a-proteobacteria)]|uniref:aspartate aminotransferase family protein n=1 Tax=Bosea sp. (in: a-proteobacteria) TaxID=1871050 RepID=UPI00261C4E26|nr:aminotransferase class III-fold pyridoxal phosphate-dependent enzyme [Bosea sp. (in: a-proteobacteria)]MCO5089523.1 aminotransferase class III-fold pyridoxal phosphate-dependent enzyme [Bosea sp. (in: a-proteobacteria)]
MLTASTSADAVPSIGRHGRLSERERGEFATAERLLPGGALGGNALPGDAKFVFARGDGSRFWDASGNEYIDYVLGSGTMFVGHAHPRIQEAVTEQVKRGTHFFAYLNEQAIELAARVTPHIRCAERIRFTTAGSDSTFHAIRLSRAFTGRSKVLKFEGAYHGVHDYAQLSTAPKTLNNFPNPLPDTAGIPEVVQDLMLVAPFNDEETLASILAEHGHDIAAVIIEPIQRIISPKPGFLQAVRDLTRKHGIVMILDEVVTGFRYGLGGAQAYFDITPDLATYGKIIGGGLPVGAVAGRADILDQANPSNKGKPGYVYQNGTLQGHPLGCAAALATMDILEEPGLYDRVFAMADKLRAGLQKVFDDNRMGLLVFGEGPMWHMLFTDKVPQNWRDIVATDTGKLARFEAEMIKQGLFVLPNNRRFISIRHDERDLADTFAAADRACKAFAGH